MCVEFFETVFDVVSYIIDMEAWTLQQQKQVFGNIFGCKAFQR